MAQSGDGAAIGRAEVLAIARLARLRLSEEEVALFTEQLNDILAHAREIADVVPDGEEGGEEDGGEDGAGARAGSRALRLRAGDAPPDALLAGPETFAPEFPEGLFAVPRLDAMDEERSP